MYCTFLKNRQYLAIIEKPKEGSGGQKKDIGAKYDLMNDLGFNLYVTSWSLVVRLVAYFEVEGSCQNRGPKEVG